MQNFIEMSTFVSNNVIDIKKLGDFEKIIQENDVKNVFFSSRTARNIEGHCFLINCNSIFYAFTYNSKYGIYKCIDDFKNGIEYNFKNAMDYYIMKEKKSKDINEYLLSEYNFNRDSIEEEMSLGNPSRAYKAHDYLEEMMDKIFELEKLKERYNVNKDYAIIIFLLFNDGENEILIEDFMYLCKTGIEIKNYLHYDDKYIKPSEDFILKWYKFAGEDWSGKKYEYDKNSFLSILKELNKKEKLFELNEEHILKK